MSLEDHANVATLRMSDRISVVLDVARLFRKEGVITTHADVVARVPVCAALPEDYVAWNDVFACGGVSLVCCNSYT